MNFSAYLGNLIIGTLAALTLNVEPFDPNQVAKTGPLILMFNHVNFIDGPIILNKLADRPLAIMAKAETWNNPFFAWVLDGWNGISVRRGEADLEAFRKAQKALAEGQIVIISPEGTRSRNGALLPGHAGVALLAARSGAPIQAIGLSGHRGFKEELYRGFKRVPLKIQVGKPFKLNLKGESLSRDNRQQVTDEIMYQLAAVLPPEYRGVYSDSAKATTQYIQPV